MARRPSVARATARKIPDLWPGDRLLLDALRARGLRADPIIWDDDAVEWRQWDGVLIRSCWDYHLRPKQFCSWLDRLEREHIHVMNPPAHKRYLFDVAARGAWIPPTRLAPCGSRRRRCARLPATYARID